MSRSFNANASQIDLNDFELLDNQNDDLDQGDDRRRKRKSKHSKWFNLKYLTRRCLHKHKKERGC